MERGDKTFSKEVTSELSPPPPIFIKLAWEGWRKQSRFLPILMHSAFRGGLMQRNCRERSSSVSIFKTSQSHLRTVVLSCPLAQCEAAKCWSCNSPSGASSETVNADLTALFRPSSHPSLPLHPCTAVPKHLPVLTSSHRDSSTWHTYKSHLKVGTKGEGPLGSI